MYTDRSKCSAKCALFQIIPKMLASCTSFPFHAALNMDRHIVPTASKHEISVVYLLGMCSIDPYGRWWPYVYNEQHLARDTRVCSYCGAISKPDRQILCKIYTGRRMPRSKLYRPGSEQLDILYTIPVPTFLFITVAKSRANIDIIRHGRARNCTRGSMLKGPNSAKSNLGQRSLGT
jgi:hypothetical protein